MNGGYKNNSDEEHDNSSTTAKNETATTAAVNATTETAKQLWTINSEVWKNPWPMSRDRVDIKYPWLTSRNRVFFLILRHKQFYSEASYSSARKFSAEFLCYLFKSFSAEELIFQQVEELVSLFTKTKPVLFETHPVV